MYQCEECQREFKTSQALAGHHQFKHGVKRAAGAAGRAAGGAAELVTRVELEQLVAAGDERAEQQDYLLGNVLQRLDELLGVVGERKPEHGEHGHGQHAEHGHGPATCDGCRDDLVGEILGENPDDAQALYHVHGDNCPQCVAQQEAGGRRSMQRTANYYEGLPGVTEIREQAYIGEQTITIVDDRSEPVNTEDLSDAEFRLLLLGVVKEAGQRGIR